MTGLSFPPIENSMTCKWLVARIQISAVKLFVYFCYFDIFSVITLINELLGYACMSYHHNGLSCSSLLTAHL